MIRAALTYFAIVFTVAFAFGIVRTVWLAPLIGATPAVLIEVPLILIVSVLAARRIAGGGHPMARSVAIGIGAIAFTLLMIVEAALAVFAFGISVRDWLDALGRLPGSIGLAGQLLFAAMPLILRETRVRSKT